MRNMEIGIVIHGPQIVDNGMALQIVKLLSNYGECTAIMAGTMGKTAVLDAHLEDIIDITAYMKPSECIEDFFKTKDIVLLLNHGKSIENGYYFANIVISKLTDRNSKPLIQIERPSSLDGEVIPWNNKAIKFAGDMAELLELPLSDVPEILTPVHIEKHGHRIVRKVYGVQAGEKILVNGIIVAYSYSEEIQIITEDGFIVDILGADVKKHGIEKLHAYEKKEPIDIANCWVKSGALRSNDFLPRNIQTPCFNDVDFNLQVNVAIIDHEAERTFEIIKDAQLALTIGDDTTEIAADILYRLNIPIIGITDGDKDGFTHKTHICPGSVIFTVTSGYDDIVGRNIKEKLFMGNCYQLFDSSTYI
jgi:hypothetical protein